MHRGVLALVILGWVWSCAALVLMVSHDVLYALVCAVESVGAAVAAVAIRGPSVDP